jgi:hypothetical protein
VRRTGQNHSWITIHFLARALHSTVSCGATQAVTELDKLLTEAAQAEEKVIIGADGSAFKLMALPRTSKPVFGSARSLVHIGPDFDEPIEGFEDDMP